MIFSKILARLILPVQKIKASIIPWCGLWGVSDHSNCEGSSRTHDLGSGLNNNKNHNQNTNSTFSIITLALCLQLRRPPQNLSMLGKSEAVGLPQMDEEPRLFPSDIRCHHYITPGALVTTDLWWWPRLCRTGPGPWRCCSWTLVCSA